MGRVRLALLRVGWHASALPTDKGQLDVGPRSRGSWRYPDPPSGDTNASIRLYAVVGRMGLISGRAVIDAAERVDDTIIKTYLGLTADFGARDSTARDHGRSGSGRRCAG
jgi:hypothetical protein